MEFKELVRTRRSCRAFDSAEVTQEQLSYILEAGQWAPSPLNAQPWEFIVVSDKGVKAQIRKIGEAAKQAVLDNGGPGWAAKYGMDYIEAAPVLIVVTVDPKKGGLGSFFGQKYGALQAASACIQNMMLAASDVGLETLWFTFFAPEKVQEALDIPQHLEIAGILPIGKPKEPVKAPPRKESKVHHQRYQKADG
jgi:5,6-dimethylbenzimidazole synthase